MQIHDDIATHFDSNIYFRFGGLLAAIPCQNQGATWWFAWLSIIGILAQKQPTPTMFLHFTQGTEESFKLLLRIKYFLTTSVSLIVGKLSYLNNLQSLGLVIMLTKTFQQEDPGRAAELQLPLAGRLHHQLDCCKVSFVQNCIVSNVLIHSAKYSKIRILFNIATLKYKFVKLNCQIFQLLDQLAGGRGMREERG